MARNSMIAWTEATWNPWHGCIKVSSGCKNCYMYRGKIRFGQNPTQILRSKTTFFDPLKWDKPSLIFACSWSDWFLEEADDWRDEAWEIIRNTPQHTYQILTKRPERIESSLPNDWGVGWDNVWLGVSIEEQKYCYRKDILTSIPSKIRFISAEPLLENIDFGSLENIDWLITGGESGPDFRIMDINWAINIKDQCLKFQIPLFHKQNGGIRLIDGAWGGRKLDGQIWDQMPS